jgi:ParB-like chromosome segregation protein Spo0J
MSPRLPHDDVGESLTLRASSQNEAETLDATILGLAALNADQLRLQWRNHLGGTQKARIRDSIKRLGICRPILVNSDFTIVEGHGVWEAAKELGIAAGSRFGRRFLRQ